MAATLYDALATLPDPRSRHGQFHPLPAVLGLVALALLMGRKSLAGIARFGRQHGAPLAHALGFRRGKTPAVSTLSRTLRRLDAARLEAILAGWLQGRVDPAAVRHVSIDGKVLRGSRDGDVPGHHLVAAYAPQVAGVLAQVRVGNTTNEHKAALELLGLLPVRGRVVVGDAMFCQRDLAERVVADGGDYVLVAKGNQAGLQTDVGAGFGFEAAARAIAAATSPSGRTTAGGAGAGGDDRGQGARAAGEADAADDIAADPARHVGGVEAGVRTAAGADGRGRDVGGGGVRGHQPAAGAGGRGGAAGADAGPLADRERAALRAGRDARGGRLPGAVGERAAGAGGGAERGGPPAGAGGRGELPGGDRTTPGTARTGPGAYRHPRV